MDADFRRFTITTHCLLNFYINIICVHLCKAADKYSQSKQYRASRARWMKSGRSPVMSGWKTKRSPSLDGSSELPLPPKLAPMGAWSRRLRHCSRWPMTCRYAMLRGLHCTVWSRPPQWGPKPSIRPNTFSPSSSWATSSGTFSDDPTQDNHRAGGFLVACLGLAGAAEAVFVSGILRRGALTSRESTSAVAAS